MEYKTMSEVREESYSKILAHMTDKDIYKLYKKTVKKVKKAMRSHYLSVAMIEGELLEAINAEVERRHNVGEGKCPVQH